MCPPTRQQSEVRPVVDEASVALASPVELLNWGHAGDHRHWRDPLSHPRALVAPHLRRDEQLHCRCPPLQPMSLLLRLRLLVLGLLVLLQGLSRQVAELAGRWSGGDRLV